MTDTPQRLTAFEDGFTERKLEGANTAELRKTLVAFANAVPEGRTGILYLGINQTGKIIGVSDPDALQRKIRASAERDCYPPVSITSEVITADGKNVVAISVPFSTNRPHFSGPAFIRRGSESIEASEKLFEELIASRHSTAGAILRLKGKVITVIALQKILGSTENLRDSSYRATHECTIEDCTAHFVRLKDIARGCYVTEPLENVSVSNDEERHRPMLIVQPD